MYDLTCNNKSILDKSNNIGWSSNSDTLGTELKFDSLYNLPEGSIISLYINNFEFLRTIIVSKSEGKFVNSYTCLDYSWYLKNEIIIQFNNTSGSKAIETMLNELGISNDIIYIPTVINKIYKDSSIIDIIDDILEQAEKDQKTKYVKEMIGDKLVVSELKNMKISPKILIGQDITINSSIKDMKNKIVVVINDEDSKSVLAHSEDESSISKYGLLQQIESIDEKNKDDAENIAENILKEKNRIINDTSLNLHGIRDAETIKANRLIEINIGNKLSGWYKIKSASHSLQNNKHAVSINLEW